MHVLLLGCTGFIGKELVPNLLNYGYRLTLVGRSSAQSFIEDFQSDNLLYLQLDPSKEEAWKDSALKTSLGECDVVINLVGEPIAEKRWSPEHCNLLVSSRIDTTRFLVEAISLTKRSPKVLINASAIGYYGTSLDSKFNESSQKGDDFLAELCEKWEQEAQSLTRNTRLVILRFGIVLSHDGGALGKMLPIFRAGFGGPLGTGKQWMSWIHRSDLCDLIHTAIVHRSWKGIFNAVAPEPTSMSMFSSTLAKTLGRPSLFPVPGAILRVLLGDGAKVVLEGQYVESERLEKMGFKFKFKSLSEALLELIK